MVRRNVPFEAGVSIGDIQAGANENSILSDCVICDYSDRLLAVDAVIVSIATGPATAPSPLPGMTVQQKSAAVQPLIRSATECIARVVRVDPRFGHSDLGDVIVDSVPRCTAEVRAMVDAY